MEEQLVLRERIRHWEEERRKAEEGERAAMEEAERCKRLRVAADEALTHLTFSLSELREIWVGGNGIGAATAAVESDQPSGEESELAVRERTGASPRQSRPRRAGPPKRQRRRRQKSSVELVPELVRDERLSVGGMKRKAEAQGRKVAKQTLEYAVKKLMEGDNPTLKRYPAEPGSAANWVYGLASEDTN
ncbi:MAG: hypothetical protein ACJ76J_23525 [Thermoanaerobaculia bacterium]